ncbi:MAG: glucose-1-phosphate thymidylyltransferase, partial [Ferruginibacter sp.]|nr:glucose-1-phosphate thymidylyltransferase [Ferruginibacter sp.]
MIVLVEKDCRDNLFPFSATRHVADILVGALTIRKKWEMLTGEKISTNENEKGIYIPANIIATRQNFKEIIEKCGNNILIAETEDIKIIQYPWQIVQLNDYALREDFAILTHNKKSSLLTERNKVINAGNTFIEEGADISHSILNASTGPIYISAGAQIMEGCMIRGPFFIGHNSIAKMGSKIYGATSIGANCVVGGEIKNSVLFGNSNKAHDGYLGDSVLGEWCNLGAGTSNSNVKNTAGNVGYILEKNAEPIYAGNKAGLLMGDYSRAAINTSFNTGSIVGVCCNIFGEIMPAKFTENFTWGK